MNTNNTDNYEEVKIKITDVTLREGDQAPFTSFIRQEKAIIALMLNEIGVNTIEAGFAASEAEKENQNIAGAIDAIGTNSNIVISSLGMAVKGNTEESLKALKNSKNSRVHIFNPTPDNHINEKFSKKGKTIEERREFILSCIKEEINRVNEYNKRENRNIEIEVSAEAATNNAINDFKILDFKSEQFQFLIKWIREAIIAGANIINIPDTLGVLLPLEIEKLFKEIVKETKDLKNKYKFRFSCHIHNDLAIATAGTVAAIRGVGEEMDIECTSLGIGERTGNTPLHEIVGIITEKPYSIIDGKKVIIPNIKTELIGPVSRFVKNILNFNKDLQAPFIGGLSDIDGSGVHNAAKKVYGGTKNKKKYGGEEIESFFSPRGGRNEVSKILKEFGVEEKAKGEIVTNITKKACLKAETTKALYYSNIYAMYLEEIGAFEIKRENIIMGNNHIDIKFKVLGEEIHISGESNGEQGFIDETIKGINKYFGKEIINIDSIMTVNKASLNEEIEKFYDDISKTTVQLSSHFKNKVGEILGENLDGKHSEQNGVSHIKTIVNGTKRTSVEYGHDVTKNDIIAIIYGVLPEIYKHIRKKIVSKRI